MLVTYGGGSVKKTGVLDQVLSALNGIDVREFGGIEPNPSYETLMNAVKIARDEKITFLLGWAAAPFSTAPNSSPRRPTMRPIAIRGKFSKPTAAK